MMATGVQYGIIKIGPVNNPFDGRPPVYTIVETPAQLEQLLEEEGRRLSRTHRCPLCGTRLVETSSVILFLPPTVRESLFCGNQLCKSNAQYLPMEDGTLRTLTREEWQALYEEGRRAAKAEGSV